MQHLIAVLFQENSFMGLLFPFKVRITASGHVTQTKAGNQPQDGLMLVFGLDASMARPGQQQTVRQASRA